MGLGTIQAGERWKTKSSPASLASSGTSWSALAPPGWARLRQRFQDLSWPGRAGVVAGVCLSLLLPVLLLLHYRSVPVAFEPVTAVFAGDIVLPSEVSSDWLLQEVLAGLREQLGTVEVVGDLAADAPKMFYSASVTPPVPPAPRARFAVGLHCGRDLCVFSVTRRAEGEVASRQAVLLPDMPLWQWRTVVRDTTRALYR